MHLADVWRFVPHVAGVTVATIQDNWIVVLACLGVMSLVSLFIWDVKRAGGMGAWAQELLPAAESWASFFDRRAQRRRRRQRQKR